MIQIATKRTLESKAIPGVSFTVRRLSHMRRAARDLSTLDARAKMTKILREYNDLGGDDETKLAQLSMEARDRRAVLNQEFALLMSQRIKPASILTALHSISGLASEDGPIQTAAQLLDNASPELDALMEEIYEACEEASGLDAAETKNSPSPTMSPEQETVHGLPTAPSVTGSQAAG